MCSRPSTMASLLRGAAGAALLSVLAVASRAESDPLGSVTRFFLEQRRSLPDDRQPSPFGHRGSARVPAAVPRPSAASRPSAPSRIARSFANAPRKAPAMAAAIYGDRLALALARGLEEDAADWLAVISFTSDDAGLARNDFAAWLQTVRTRLQKPDRPGVAVVMLGANDRQPLLDGTASVEPATPRWLALYTARIDAVTAAFRDAHVPLVWVGLPAVRGDEASADFVRLNALFRDRAGKGGATFVDSWEAFSDDVGNYSPMGPDVDGQIVKLRKADGFGFTRAGARKLASFVEKDIKRVEAPPTVPETPPQIADFTIEKARDFDQALDIDVNAQIQREAGLSASGAAAAGKPSAGPQPPPAGPVLSLTAAPTSPDGTLATASVPPPAILQATLVAREAGKEGEAKPVAAPPGRADDFSWPKP